MDRKVERMTGQMKRSLPPVADKEIIEIAVKAAKAAGKIQLEARKESLVVDKLFAHDIKLEADRKSEEAIINIVKEKISDAGFMAEESDEVKGSGEYLWIIDPLDGTMNYFHGQHHFCTCVACYRLGKKISESGISRLGEPVVGVVYAPAYDEIFVGDGKGNATCNSSAINASDVDELKNAIVTTSFGSKPRVMEAMQKIIGEMVRKTRKVRIQGSCGLDICSVAAGRLSALYQRDVRCWDFAAARVVLEAAGGKIEAKETAPNRWDVLACAPGIYDELTKLVNP
jgi:fructose-1,6-bisphosphatase/inositol monophosphatase family enzyme